MGWLSKRETLEILGKAVHLLIKALELEPEAWLSCQIYLACQGKGLALTKKPVLDSLRHPNTFTPTPGNVPLFYVKQD